MKPTSPQSLERKLGRANATKKKKKRYNTYNPDLCEINISASLFFHPASRPMACRIISYLSSSGRRYTGRPIPREMGNNSEGVMACRLLLILSLSLCILPFSCWYISIELNHFLPLFLCKASRRTECTWKSGGTRRTHRTS